MKSQYLDYRDPSGQDLPPAPPLYNPSEDSSSQYGGPAGTSLDMDDAVFQGSNAVPVPNLSPKDVVIAIMGITGVGKSTFISHFSDTAKVGSSLESCTTDVGIHEARIGGQRCFLIDTPGFDDTHRSDTDVLREIADWLNRSYQNNIQLAGIVYLHRITDPRVGGSSLKNLRMFKKLCGAKGLSCVVLATTMWSQIDPDDGQRRERELVSNKEFWGEMVKQGSRVMRQDRDEASAIQIIQYILQQRHRMVLDIQTEMASGKTLDETSAGRELEAELERLRKQHDEEMRELREDMMEAQRANDQRAQEEIAAIRDDLQKKMDQDKQDRERMRVTMEELQKQREDELRAERDKNHALALDHQKAMAENASKLRMMELDTTYKIQVAQLKFDKERSEAENERWRAEEAKRKADECCVM
ncbi:P-loop containing nucleoside triphosphate hydrolase protein [Rhexocercosporidium sp. MPI-PUGE-AT-0058]|nr:P-loop containing nucleoside triphosphate hydrolase protein [Rhexocercosporidium sp. MPI-PUGE-AT-0058]